MRKSAIFKLISAVLAIMMLLSACGADTSGDVLSTPRGTDKPDAAGVVKPEKRDIKYPETYSALKEIEYNTERVIGSALIKDKLFILEEDGIHIVDLASGEVSHVLEKEGLLNLCADNDNAYTYDNQGVIYTLDISGNIISESQVLKGALPDNVFEPVPKRYRRDYFIATEDYLVLSYTEVGVGYLHAYILKSDMSIITSEKDRKSVVIFSGSGNEYYTVTGNPYGGNILKGYDIEKDTSGDKIEISGDPNDFSYDKYSGCIITFGGGISQYGMSLTEFPQDVSLMNRLTIFPQFGKVSLEPVLSDIYCERLSVYNNIYCVVSHSLGKIVTYDTEKAENTLNIAMKKELVGSENTDYIAAVLKDKYDINVVINGYDTEAISLKLMAGDDDIDVFYTGVLLNIPYFVKSSCFVDLNEFDVLKENISTCKSLLENCFSYDGKIFGIPPVRSYISESKDEFVNDCSKPMSNITGDYAQNAYAYRAKYFNFVENEYSDKDGKMLYKLLKHTYDNKTDQPYVLWSDPSNIDEICEGVYTVQEDCYMINPAAKNKESAAIFLNEMLNLGLGKLPLYGNLQRFGITLYDLSFDYTKCYPLWRACNTDARTIYYEAVEKAYNAKSAKEVKEISKECYRKIRQITLE